MAQKLPPTPEKPAWYRQPWLKQLPLYLLIAAVAFIGGTRSTEIMARLTPADQQLKLGELQVLYNQLSASFDGDLSPAKALEGAKKGMVEATDDPYTTFFTEQEAKEFTDELNGKYEGIGAELAKRNDNVVIVSTMDNSPAKAAGLMSGDIVAQIDDHESLGWTVEKVVKHIRGDKGSKVKLTIIREAVAKEFTITRDTIVNPSVKAELLADNVGYLRVSTFGNDTGTLSQQKAQWLLDQGAKSFILDLRGNGGGRVEASQFVASLWLENKPIASMKRHDGSELETLNSFQNAILKGKKTIVLIDGGSASASEIVAGALHDHKAARLVGQQTFGKGSVQTTTDSIGGELKVTTAKWYTPAGKNISKDGIKPDVNVELKAEDLNAGRDPQKDKALELLR